MFYGTNRGAVTEHDNYTLIAPEIDISTKDVALRHFTPRLPIHTTLHHLSAGLQARHDACPNTHTRSPNSRRGMKQLAYSIVVFHFLIRLADCMTNGIVGCVPPKCFHTYAIRCRIPS
jgi:hypothetical protein